ncbi:beta-galactosidase [Cellulophaga sp. F20128]|uniref:beta-galactosidase n=1 Tax=Cellulophaga sp. F20128 TaxID=2926413 RepID=UPI001FF384B7|nr:beta-galactosidase [Cellulophaga sp. F20128]MCK0158518.1 beta-galactosidase [Cellulophaga sp. F20128]
MNKSSLFFLLLITFLLSCSSTDGGTNSEDLDNSATILKPKGLYTSSIGNEIALDHPQVKGSLIRVKWSDLEPSAGVYDFTKIEQFRELIKTKNLKWSLGVIAGSSSPEWLTTTIGADYFEITTSDATIKKIPKIWDAIVNERLALLAEALANSYSEDADLVLVYTPQMTANGIEGHFNGVPKEELLTAGLTAENWISSVKETAKIFATAFLDKPIAVEVHDIIGETSIPNQIMTDLWNDPSLDQRVGAAMWWISGKTTYQPNLVNALTNFPGDIYAQAIGRSDQTERFENDDYTSVFEQAKIIGIRYIELWEYEFINNTFPQDFICFNSYTATNFE